MFWKCFSFCPWIHFSFIVYISRVFSMLDPFNVIEAYVFTLVNCGELRFPLEVGSL